MVTVKCTQCNIAFKRKNYLKTTPFCSQRCYGLWQRIHRIGFRKERFKVNCFVCHKEIELTKSKILERNFCSKPCTDIWRAESNSFAGEKNPAWRGGGPNWRGLGWRKLSRQIRKRDNDTCQHCGEEGRDVHHIRPFRCFRDEQLANQPDNLITLCSSCHKKADELYWREHPEDMQESYAPDGYQAQYKRCEQLFVASEPHQQMCMPCKTHVCGFCGISFYTARKYRQFCGLQCSTEAKKRDAKWPHQCQYCGKQIHAGRLRCFTCFMTIDHPYTRKLTGAHVGAIPASHSDVPPQISHRVSEQLSFQWT